MNVAIRHPPRADPGRGSIAGPGRLAEHEGDVIGQATDNVNENDRWPDRTLARTGSSQSSPALRER
jgi:hypothetical protein